MGSYRQRTYKNIGPRQGKKRKQTKNTAVTRGSLMQEDYSIVVGRHRKLENTNQLHTIRKLERNTKTRSYEQIPYN